MAVMRALTARPRSREENAMLENRSVPPDSILPHVEYQDLAAAVAWLTKTFGFIEHYRYGDPISGVGTP
jgi:hypothetical protein